MQVSPGPNAIMLPQKRYQYSRDVAVFLWLWSSLVSSIWYLSYFSSYFENNLLWSDYNTSGYQTFLIDCINNILELQNQTSMSKVGVEQNYASPWITPKLHAAYPMTLLTTKLISLEHAIVSIRNTTPADLPWLPMHYCWVDFNKRWELAHTQQRQRRCQLQYSYNGAVYLESILRNTNWLKMVGLNYPISWQVGLFDGIQASLNGSRFLHELSAANTTLQNEVQYWQSYNVTKYQLQWQDYLFPALDEVITINNAIGISMPVVLKSTPQKGGYSMSYLLSPYFGFDLFMIAITCNFSLIRNTPNYFVGKQCDLINVTMFEDFSYLGDGSGNYRNQSAILRNTLGPFLSSDLWVLPLPTLLENFLVEFLSILHDKIVANPQLDEIYSSIETLSVNPTPPAWKGDYLYYGGNPLCLDGVSQSFVLSSISFLSYEDSCSHQYPLSLTLRPSSIILALYFSHKLWTIDNICTLQLSPSCFTTLSLSSELLNALSFNLSNKFEFDKVAQSVSIMQFATDSTKANWTILKQPLLDESSPWVFYGWVMIFDWALGLREVISIQGDNGTMVLMSEAFNISSTIVQKGSLTNASEVVYYLLVYFTVVMSLLGVICTLASFNCQVSNLAFFHRLVGSTWIGRPLMFLRGATAIVLLSSAPIRLEYNSSITRFNFADRSLVETITLSYEATWIAVVIHEFFLPFTTHNARLAGTVNVFISWLTCVCVDVTWPIKVDTQFSYDCQAINMITQLYCTSGVIEIGSSDRILLLFQLQCIGILIILLFGLILTNDQQKQLSAMTMSSAGQAYLTPPMDRLSCILVGVLPLSKKHSFDIKLWSFISLQHKEPSTRFLQTKFSHPRRIKFTAVILGALYIVLSISSSISYLQLLQIKLPNDLVWTGFNVTGVHVFLATWFLESFNFYNLTSTIQLNDHIVNSFGLYNLTNPVILFNGHIGAHKQYTDLTDLSSVIAALRKLDACQAPWLFTQYCYLDFQRKWEMANSARRQERCLDMVSNGAVFLEAVLRNVDKETWASCWGDAFDIAIGNELKQSIIGVDFLQTLTVTLEVGDEQIYWKQFAINSYTLQWQNYKYIGIVNTYTISNAFQTSYSFTIATTRGAYRWNDQTSLKMYWAFGNDLKSILDNSTLIGGKSLLRSSSKFAFSNISLQDVYLDSTSYIPSPWHAVYRAQELYLGPFGSIDMIYVAVPNLVREILRHYLVFVQEIRSLDPILYLNTSELNAILPVPKVWTKETLYTIGGSILCPIQNVGIPISISISPYPSFSFQVKCDQLASYWALYQTQNHVIFATIFSNIKEAMNISKLCEQALYTSDSCQRELLSTFQLLTKFPPNALYNTWATSLYDAINSLNIEWMQFVQDDISKRVEVNHIPVLNPADSDFDFFAWQLLYGWFIGSSEVVSFQGDNGQLTLLSNTLDDYRQPTDLSQLPIVFVLFAKRGVEYVTFVMIGVASLAFLYIILSRGCIEGLNMFELSRVGGIVWIGRPLVLLRSLTALCLLSTASVALNTQNQMNYFSNAPEVWYKTCLAANEVTWLVGIINDVFVVYTKEWTLKYATINSILVSFISACLATILPVQPTITLNPQCQIDTLDFQVICNAGNVEIGSSMRLLHLFGIVIMCNFVCYIIVRWYFKGSSNTVSTSLLLSGGARYLFTQKDWTFDETYYLDCPSALLTGLLSCRYDSTWYVFDVKTWRVYKLQVPSKHLGPNKSFQWALPLQSQ